MALEPASLRTKLIRSLTPVVIGLIGLSLVACAPTVPMEAAKHATATECAEVSVRLPNRIDDLERVNTNAQGTAAWGNPTAVLLRCGLEMPVASNEICTKAGDVDWLAEARSDDDYVFISYGRNPAVEVIVNNIYVSGRTVLEAVNDAVRILDQEHYCLDFGDLEAPPSVD